MYIPTSWIVGEKDVGFLAVDYVLALRLKDTLIT